MQAVLESKQMVEERIALKRIKESLAPKRGGSYHIVAHDMDRRRFQGNSSDANGQVGLHAFSPDGARLADAESERERLRVARARGGRGAAAPRRPPGAPMRWAVFRGWGRLVLRAVALAFRNHCE